VLGIDFTGERIVPGAANCEPTFAQKMYQEHLARYAFAAQLTPGCEVLDVACGVGYGSQWLAKSGAKSVLGIDIAEDAIEHARKHYFHPAVTYKVLDALALDLQSEFDVVTCFEFIEHVDEQEKVLDAIKRALRPDGKLIISTPRPLSDKRTDFHVHELKFEELRQMLSDRFPQVESFFERNCFTSFVGASLPDRLDQIVSVTDQLQLDDADYFIFVAQRATKPQQQELKPLIAVNDDSYVLRLEQDAINFRNGENYHNQLINDLSRKNENLAAELESTQSDLKETRHRVESLSSMHEEITKIVTEVASIREEMRDSSQLAAIKADVASLRRSNDELASARVELEALRHSREELVSVKAELEKLRRSRDDFTQQAERLVAENGRIRTVLSKVAQQLAETETRLNSRSVEADQLRAELGVIREARAREMQELTEKYEQSERTLNRFRRSVSWQITRPIRWVGRQFRKITGRSVA
jgi:SAM-dependent methyltransferase